MNWRDVPVQEFCISLLVLKHCKGCLVIMLHFRNNELSSSYQMRGEYGKANFHEWGNDRSIYFQRDDDDTYDEHKV